MPKVGWSQYHKILTQCQRRHFLNKIDRTFEIRKKMRKKEMCRIRGEYSKRLSSFYISFFSLYTRVFPRWWPYVHSQTDGVTFLLSFLHPLDGILKKCMIQRKVTKSSHHGHTVLKRHSNQRNNIGPCTRCWMARSLLVPIEMRLPRRYQQVAMVATVSYRYRNKSHHGE
jgi:hypothetical protein